MIEALESRRHLSATVGARGFVPPDGVLRINGSTMSDRITIFRTRDNFLIVDHLAGSVDPKTGEFRASIVIDYIPLPAAQIRQIVITDDLGNDVLDVRDAGVRATLIGGRGDDILIGSAQNDVLRGGAGNDSLHGAAGADLLGGGDGNDALFGQDGSDSLFGGRGTDRLDGGEDASRDRYDGEAGHDTAIVRTRPLALKNVESVLAGW